MEGRSLGVSLLAARDRQMAEAGTPILITACFSVLSEMQLRYTGQIVESEHPGPAQHWLDWNPNRDIVFGDL